MQALENAFNPKVFSPKDINRTFHLAAVDQAVLTIFMPSILDLLNTAPKASFTIEHIHSRTAVIEGLRSGAIDVAILPKQEIPTDIFHQDLYLADFSLLVRQNHPLLDKINSSHPFITKDDLSDYDEIVFRMNHRLTQEASANNRISIGTEFQSTIPYFLINTDLFYIGPTKLCSLFSKIFNLVMLPVTWTNHHIHRNMLWHASTHSDPACQYVRSVIYNNAMHEKN